jgi:hypothetical protein
MAGDFHPPPSSDEVKEKAELHFYSLCAFVDCSGEKCGE